MMEAYTVLARCYDRLTNDVDYETWANYVERHFRKSKAPVHRVVELGCGTGSLTKLLAQRLEVAQLLDQGLIYNDILQRTGASSATISRVNRALQYGADGYKTVLPRLSK